MGKFLNSNDYFTCSQGISPAQMQNSQQVAGKENGGFYLTTIDMQTKSYGDFVCTKLVQLVALVAALIAATGGAALAAIIAVAAAAGGVTIAFGLLCGKGAAMLRKPWLSSKNNVFLGSAAMPAVTEISFMKCGMGGTITYKPNIKTWWQAMLVTGSNTIINMFKAVIAGGTVTAIIQFAIKGVAGFLTQATYNCIALWTTKAGIGIRGFLGANEMIQEKYVDNTYTGPASSFAKGVVSIETGLSISFKRLFTGQGGIGDLLNILAIGGSTGSTKGNSIPETVMDNPINKTYRIKNQPAANDNAIPNGQESVANNNAIPKGQENVNAQSYIDILMRTEMVRKYAGILKPDMSYEELNKGKEDGKYADWTKRWNPNKERADGEKGDWDDVTEERILLNQNNGLISNLADVTEVKPGDLYADPFDPTKPSCSYDPAPESIKRMEQQLADEPYERIVFYDKNGKQLTGILLGSEMSAVTVIKYNPASFKNVIGTHNHPGLYGKPPNPRLSISDINEIVKNNGLAIRVVSKGGSVHSIERVGDKWNDISQERWKELHKEHGKFLNRRSSIYNEYYKWDEELNYNKSQKKLVEAYAESHPESTELADYNKSISELEVQRLKALDKAVEESKPIDQEEQKFLEGVADEVGGEYKIYTPGE